MASGSGHEDSLAAHLSDLADNPGEQSRPRPSPQPHAPGQRPIVDESGSPAGELHDMVSQSVKPASASSTRATPIRRGQKDAGLKIAAVIALQVVGLLLIPPALWGTLLLLGHEVPMAERENARFMARVMLVCWPIALILLGSGWALLWQVLRRNR